MAEVTMRSYAKINLSLDVVGCRGDGYHDIMSLMQDVSLFDDVKICSKALESADFSCNIRGINVCLTVGVNTIEQGGASAVPVDDSNLAIKGARAVIEAAPRGTEAPRAIGITLDKHLPIAAGIAGGSGNAAVVMLAVNKLLNNVFTLQELMELGVDVGADVPFSIFMNAKLNEEQLQGLIGLESAGTAAMVSGIGEIVDPCLPIKRFVILMNPRVQILTQQAYQAVDEMTDRADKYGLFQNIFQEYALSASDETRNMIEAMRTNLNAEQIVMSGSGPTTVAYYQDEDAFNADLDKALTGDWVDKKWCVWSGTSGGSVNEF